MAHREESTGTLSREEAQFVLQPPLGVDGPTGRRPCYRASSACAIQHQGRARAVQTEASEQEYSWQSSRACFAPYRTRGDTWHVSRIPGRPAAGPALAPSATCTSRAACQPRRLAVLMAHQCITYTLVYVSMRVRVQVLCPRGASARPDSARGQREALPPPPTPSPPGDWCSARASMARRSLDSWGH